MADVLKNPIVDGMIEECLIDKVSPGRFPPLLTQALVSTITVRRRNAPELVEILNDSKQLKIANDEYTRQFTEKYPEDVKRIEERMKERATGDESEAEGPEEDEEEPTDDDE
jgi:hypothetical protein